MVDSILPSPPRVLVVDDNSDLAENIAEMFTGRGCRTFAVFDGGSAEAFGTDKDFDLAIVDIALPDASGVEVATRLKECRPLSEVVLLTANATLDSAIAAVRGGIYAYVQKPFDPNELIALGERAISQVQLRRERARLERDLEQSEALYRGVVDAVDSFIVGLWPDGAVRMWNRSAERATGHSGRAVIGKPFETLLTSPRARDGFSEALAQANAGLSIAGFEAAIRTSVGGSRLVRWNLRPFAGEDERAALVLAVGEDLTDRIDLERRAAEAEAMASLGTLTAGLAHEIRNPLNAATLQLELIRRQGDRLADEPVRSKIETRVGIVREELARLTKLLDDFLNLAKPKGLSLHPVELCKLVDEVIELEEPEAGRHGIKIRKSTQDATMIALGDRHMLKQVLMNLLVNAIEALRERGQGNIEVQCQELSEYRLEIGIRDDGPGVPSEISDRLFSPFVTTKEAGTGLGLTIVKRIIDRHGGTLSVSPARGGGTIVRVALPRAPRPAC